MSPTTRVGESDPNRGTAPEAITPGRDAASCASTSTRRSSVIPVRQKMPTGSGLSFMSPIGFESTHEVAGAFAYLGSSEADHITGAILSIDGAITT